MKPTLTTITVLITAALLISCAKSDEKSEAVDAKDVITKAVEKTKEAVYAIEGLNLNDGLKWEVDDHTRSTLSKMAVSFSSSYSPDADAETLKNAGVELQNLINELVQGCSMTGEAHDQLHAFLTAYMPTVASLSESGQIEDAQKIKSYLETYGEYFE